MLAGAGRIERTHQAVLEPEDALLLASILEVGPPEAQPDRDALTFGVSSNVASLASRSPSWLPGAAADAPSSSSPEPPPSSRLRKLMAAMVPPPSALDQSVGRAA